MITDRSRYSHQESHVDLRVRHIGTRVLRSGLHGIAYGVDPQPEPMGEHSLQLGKGSGTGVLDAAHSCDGA